MKNLTIQDLELESSRLQTLIGATEVEISDLKIQLDNVRAEIARRVKPAIEPRVSDHALLRYIERILDIDIEAVRKEILTDNIVDAINVGATGVTVNGVKMVVKDKTIVTVISHEHKPKKKRIKETT